MVIRDGSTYPYGASTMFNGLIVLVMLSAVGCGIAAGSILVARARWRQTDAAGKRLAEERRLFDVERRRLLKIADGFPYMISRWDRNLICRYANAAYRRRATTNEHLEGRSLAELYGKEFVAGLRVRLDAVLRGEAQQFDSCYFGDDGALHDTSVNLLPIYDEGVVTGYYSVAADITERKGIERRLAQQTEMLEVTTSLARVGGWQLDLASEHMTWTKNMFDVYELPHGELPTFEQILSHFHGAARDKVLESTQAVLTSGTKVEFEVPFITSKGNHRWMRALCVTSEQEGVRKLAGAVQDVTAQHSDADSLRTAKDRAEAASFAKGQFLANMSHEIRTPLNGVIGMTTLLLDTPLTEEQREYVEIARTSGESLLSLISDILDLSKIEAGRLELETVEFNLTTVINEAVDAVAFKAGEKGLQLVIDIDVECPVWVRGDPTRMRQVILNLLSNAVKFADQGEVMVSVRPGRRVTVAGAPPRVALEIAVVDQGVGISAENLEKLFAPFTQADASTTRRFGGTGLGLSISRRLAAAMGGSLNVDSVLGEGSTFRFDAWVEDLARTVPDTGAHVLGSPSALIVSPYLNTARVLASQFEQRGFKSEYVLEGDLALKRWKSLAINAYGRTLIVIDRDLGGADPTATDALRLARDIRYSDPGLEVRLVLAKSLSQTVTSEERTLFDGLLTKPAKRQALTDVIRSAFGASGTRSKSPVLLNETPELPDVTLRGKHVLLVDDNLVNLKLAERVLMRLGLSVTRALNGREALAMLSAVRFDVVLMDCQMPEMDGYEATRELRTCEAAALNRDVPVIALTADALAGDEARCLAAGMNAYMTKPMDPGRLESVLYGMLDPAPRAHVSAAQAPAPAETALAQVTPRLR